MAENSFLYCVLSPWEEWLFYFCFSLVDCCWDSVVYGWYSFYNISSGQMMKSCLHLIQRLMDYENDGNKSAVSKLKPKSNSVLGLLSWRGKVSVSSLAYCTFCVELIQIQHSHVHTPPHKYNKTLWRHRPQQLVHVSQWSDKHRELPLPLPPSVQRSYTVSSSITVVRHLLAPTPTWRKSTEWHRKPGPS